MVDLGRCMWCSYPMTELPNSAPSALKCTLIYKKPIHEFLDWFSFIPDLHGEEHVLIRSLKILTKKQWTTLFQIIFESVHGQEPGSKFDSSKLVAHKGTGCKKGYRVPSALLNLSDLISLKRVKIVTWLDAQTEKALGGASLALTGSSSSTESPEIEAVRTFLNAPIVRGVSNVSAVEALDTNRFFATFSHLFTLEAHRRVIGLEKFLRDNKSSSFELLRQMRPVALNRMYTLVDPYTLTMMLCSSIVLEENTESLALNRAKAVAQDAYYLIEYGKKLTNISRLVSRNIGNTTPMLDFYTLDWIPTDILSQIPVTAPTDGFIQMRKHRDQHSLSSMLKTLNVDTTPVVSVVARFKKDVGTILSKDSHSLQLTRYLPATPSMPDASLDIEAFLSQRV